MARMTSEALQAQRRAASEARGAIGTRLMGGRKDLVKRARELVEVARATVEAEMASPESVRDFCEAINYGATKEVMDRTCLNLKAQILRLVSQERVLLVEYVRQLGASSEDEARKAVEAYRSADGADLVTAIERCVAFLEGALPMHEEHRGMVVRRLGGYLPVAMDENPIPGA